MNWHPVRDGDARLMGLYRRHYSCVNRNPRQPKCIGPGEHLALLTTCGRAAFVWKLERHRRDGQGGINCSIFRNEGVGTSSALILEAELFALAKWPQCPRFFTFVDPKHVSANPGYCFKQAGWILCGRTKAGLHILEKELVPHAV